MEAGYVEYAFIVCNGEVVFDNVTDTAGTFAEFVFIEICAPQSVSASVSQPVKSNTLDRMHQNKKNRFIFSLCNLSLSLWCTSHALSRRFPQV